MYDADEGYSIDEYWLSYFKDMDLALEKLHLVLDTFRKLRHEPETTRVSMDQDIGDTTRKAVADIDDPADQHKNYRKDKKENKESRRSLTDKMSSMFLNSAETPETHSAHPTKTDSTLSTKSSSQASTLASKLKLFSSSSSAPATPPSASVATLRPAGQDDSDATTIASSTAPPPIGQTSQPSSSETLPVSAQSHTYPPEPSSTGPAEPPRRTSTLGKIFSASTTGSRKILEVVTHSNLPGSRNTKAKSATEQRPDPNKTVLDETVVEEPDDAQEDDSSSSKSVVEFRKMFGLSDKEELLEREFRPSLRTAEYFTESSHSQSTPLISTEACRSLDVCTFRPTSSVSARRASSPSRPK